MRDGEALAGVKNQTTGSRASAKEWTDVLSSPWMLAVILAAGFLVYAQTLTYWFWGDDFWFLRAMQTHASGSYIVTSFDVRNTGTSLEFDRYRPLYPLVWKMQYAVFGLHPLPYHAVIIALHMVSIALVWTIARRLLRHPAAANLVALIFALHPAYIDAIGWISGGNRVFVAVPYLLALLLFMQYRSAAGRVMRAYYGASILSYIAAILFHPSSVTLLPMLPAYVFLVAGPAADARRVWAWLPFVPFFVITAASAGVQLWVRGHLGAEQGFAFGWHQYANYGHDFGLALVPIEPSNQSGAFATLIGALQGVGSVAMAVAAIGLMFRARRAAAGLFAAIWLLVALFPDSTLTLGTNGRTLYAPGAAMAIVIVSGLLWLRDELPERVVHSAARVAPYAVIAGALLTVPMIYGRLGSTRSGARNNERFIAQLRTYAPSWPGGTLYVDRAPANLVLFDDSRLQALVQLYYGDDAPVKSIHGQVVPGPADRVFRYEP